MILRAQLEGLSSELELVKTQDQTLNLRQALRYPACGGGRSVALWVSDVALAIQALIALDGAATKICLLSPSLCGEDLARLIAAAESDLLLIDENRRAELPPLVCAVEDVKEALAKACDVEPCGVRRNSDWLLATSGTTGAPKLISHTLGSLTRSVKRGDFQGARHAGRCWGLLYDFSRFAGLQVVLQSLLSGDTLIAPPHSALLGEQIEQLAAQACTHLSATPTLWRQLLMTPDRHKLQLRQITLGGEIADQPVLSELAQAFPAARISHVYASTEAGVCLSVSDGQAGFPAAYLSDNPGRARLKIKDGRLFVFQSQVANDAGQDMPASGDDGFWMDTGDLVVKEGARVFFLGRASGVINVGGDKVSPEEIEAVLLEHEKVAAASAYGKNNPITGQVVGADIVVRSGAGTVDGRQFKAELMTFVRQRLPKYKVPALIKIVDQLQVNAAGKHVRK